MKDTVSKQEAWRLYVVGVIIDKFEFDGFYFFSENEELIEFKPGNFSSAPIMEIETFEEFVALFNKTYTTETEREEKKIINK